MSVAYLEKLNPGQRRAVEHGVRANDAAPGLPLLVIAGAGSGKTNTLAHRVAYLIVNSADPRKILLMTFSRRAAAEMARRVERIARRVIGDSAGVMTDALWDGTFHGIGARLLRDYAGEIGLDPAVTVHVGAMNIAGSQRAPFQIAELVEYEQRMITGAFVVAVPDAVLLFAMGRAYARIMSSTTPRGGRRT